MNEETYAQMIQLAKSAAKIDLVIFAGRVGGRFMDNVKYLFRHCANQDLPFRSYFLTHQPEEHELLQKAGLPSLMFPSNEALRLLPRAKLVVADDFWWKTQTAAFYLLSQAQTVQLWHGIPLKLIGFPEIESTSDLTPERRNELTFGYSGYDVAISTSPHVTSTSLGKVFQTKEMWETGYPRNDVLLREPDAVDLMGVDMVAYRRIKGRAKAGSKIVFFMPTFRDSGGDPFSDGALDLAAMDAFGRKNNIVFALKFHPYLSVNADLGMENVFVVNAETDAYPLLRYADCLLTDYSSVAYDYLLTDKPMVFFPYDLAKYLSKDRGMFYPFEDMAPGPKPTDQEGLFAVLRDILVHGKDDHGDERKALANLLFTDLDGNAAQRITDRIVKKFFTSS